MNILIFTLLLVTLSAAQKDKKTTLEDIERDYVTNERKTKLTPPQPTPPRVGTPAQSPTQFGFVPKKTIADYVQQEYRPAYLQPQYTQQYVQQQQLPVNDYPQYSTAQQYTTSIPQKYNTGTQYTVPHYASQQPKYTPQVSNQQAQGYSYVTQLPTQLQSLENVQYVTDNSITTPVAPQYYTPQYVYLQQYTSPSTAVQTVVEPKGAVQYIMYVPAYVPSTAAEQSQNYENVVYAGEDAQVVTSSYQVSPPSQAPQRATHNQYARSKESVQYKQPKNKYANSEYIIRREPKSLLDSYIPSIVQLQYYNRAAQQNSVQEPVKPAQTVAAKEYTTTKNNYRPEGPSSAETSLSYRYQPVSYRS